MNHLFSILGPLWRSYLTHPLGFLLVYIYAYSLLSKTPPANLSRWKIPIIPAGLRPIFRFAILARLANCSRALGHTTPPFSAARPLSAAIPSRFKQCVKIEKKEMRKTLAKDSFCLLPLSSFSWPFLLFLLALSALLTFAVVEHKMKALMLDFMDSFRFFSHFFQMALSFPFGFCFYLLFCHGAKTESRGVFKAGANEAKLTTGNELSSSR